MRCPLKFIQKPCLKSKAFVNSYILSRVLTIPDRNDGIFHTITFIKKLLSICTWTQRHISLIPHHTSAIPSIKIRQLVGRQSVSKTQSPSITAVRPDKNLLRLYIQISPFYVLILYNISFNKLLLPILLTLHFSCDNMQLQ